MQIAKTLAGVRVPAATFVKGHTTQKWDLDFLLVITFNKQHKLCNKSINNQVFFSTFILLMTHTHTHTGVVHQFH